jgi:8-oxo-dGTP pyrophosphatase MutT (NUDIX family)
MTQAQPLSPQEHYRRRGKHISGAGMIIRDRNGRVLLVHTTYGNRLWEIPGGGLEPGEYPADGARREIAEEIGLTITPGRVLAIDFVPYTPPFPDAPAGLLANYLFDGGTTHPGQIKPDLDEIDEARFCDRHEYHQLLPAHMARRVDACLNALTNGHTAYLHHGRDATAAH